MVHFSYVDTGNWTLQSRENSRTQSGPIKTTTSYSNPPEVHTASGDSSWLPWRDGPVANALASDSDSDIQRISKSLSRTILKTQKLACSRAENTERNSIQRKQIPILPSNSFFLVCVQEVPFVNRKRHHFAAE